MTVVFYIFEEKKGNISDFCFDKPKACSFPFKHSAPVRFITCFELPCQLHPSGITTTTNMTNCKVKHCAVQALCFPRCIFPMYLHCIGMHWIKSTPVCISAFTYFPRCWLVLPLQSHNLSIVIVRCDNEFGFGVKSVKVPLVVPVKDAIAKKN